MLLLLWGCSTRPASVPLMDSTDDALLLATVRMPLRYVETLPTHATLRPTFAFTPSVQAGSSGLMTPPPDCFRQAQRGLVCIGQIVNTGLQAVENLRLRLQSGSATQTVTPEQRLIPSGGFAPYRVIFPNADNERASVAVLSLRESDLTPPKVTVLTETGRYTPQRTGYGIYHYEAILRAEDDYRQPWQAIVTLFSGHQQVVGYRIIEQHEALIAGQTVTLRALITPLLVDTRYYTTLTISPR